MQTIINLDDELVFKAASDTGISNLADLLHEGLRALVYREAARKLIDLGGSQPDLEDIPRRRPAA